MPGYVKPEILIFLVVTVSAICGGWMAANRCRNVVGWCFLCGLIPLFLLVIYGVKPLCSVEGKFKACPNCHQLIRWKAPVCRYCNQAQPPST